MEETRVKVIGYPVAMDERSGQTGSTNASTSATKLAPNVFKGVPGEAFLLVFRYMELNLKRRMKSSYKTLGSRQRTRTRYLSRRGIPRSRQAK